MKKLTVMLMFLCALFSLNATAFAMEDDTLSAAIDAPIVDVAVPQPNCGYPAGYQGYGYSKTFTEVDAYGNVVEMAIDFFQTGMHGPSLPVITSPAESETVTVSGEKGDSAAIVSDKKSDSAAASGEEDGSAASAVNSDEQATTLEARARAEREDASDTQTSDTDAAAVEVVDASEIVYCEVPRIPDPNVPGYKDSIMSALQLDDGTILYFIGDPTKIDPDKYMGLTADDIRENCPPEVNGGVQYPETVAVDADARPSNTDATNQSTSTKSISDGNTETAGYELVVASKVTEPGEEDFVEPSSDGESVLGDGYDPSITPAVDDIWTDNQSVNPEPGENPTTEWIPGYNPEGRNGLVYYRGENPWEHQEIQLDEYLEGNPVLRSAIETYFDTPDSHVEIWLSRDYYTAKIIGVDGQTMLVYNWHCSSDVEGSDFILVQVGTTEYDVPIMLAVYANQSRFCFGFDDMVAEAWFFRSEAQTLRDYLGLNYDLADNYVICHNLNHPLFVG